MVKKAKVTKAKKAEPVQVPIPPSQRRVTARDMCQIVASTLQRYSSGVFFRDGFVADPDSREAWINYEAEADILIREMLYGDDAFKVTNHEFNPPYCERHYHDK